MWSNDNCFPYLWTSVHVRIMCIYVWDVRKDIINSPQWGSLSKATVVVTMYYAGGTAGSLFCRAERVS